MRDRLIFWICLVSTLSLLIAGFFVPPQGIIDASVLTAGAILFAFAALSKVDKLLAKGYDARIHHGDTSVVFSNGDQSPAPLLHEEEYR